MGGGGAGNGVCSRGWPAFEAAINNKYSTPGG